MSKKWGLEKEFPIRNCSLWFRDVYQFQVQLLSFVVGSHGKLYMQTPARNNQSYPMQTSQVTWILGPNFIHFHPISSGNWRPNPLTSARWGNAVGIHFELMCPRSRHRCCGGCAEPAVGGCSPKWNYFIGKMMNITHEFGVYHGILLVYPIFRRSFLELQSGFWDYKSVYSLSIINELNYNCECNK